jgi:hypothetical protein
VADEDVHLHLDRLGGRADDEILVDDSFTNLGSSLCITTTSCLRFSTTSVTSSITPGMFESSCSTPLIRTAVAAAPWIDESSVRRSALPSVSPKPRSSGSTMKRE